MRYEIRYRCTFRYASPAAESQNEVRVCPSSEGGQTVVHASVVTVPSSRVLTATDYWGTRVDAFGVRAPHDGLTIEMTAVVEVAAPQPMTAVVDVVQLTETSFVDAHREYLQPSALAEPSEAITELARTTAAGVADVISLAAALCTEVESRVEHRSGVTEVATTADEVLASHRGVCQDRAHLLISMCRVLGLPARYVSGYLCAGPTGADTTTHAWVEVAVPGEGWHVLDPSDGGVEDQRRVVIGRGRDYSDVPPLRGTYVGGDEHTCDVAVEIAELTPVTRT